MKAVLISLLMFQSLLAFSSAPARNPFLASDKYAMANFDNAQTNLMPYPVRRGEFFVNLEMLPKVVSGPVNIMTLASTNRNFMWSISSHGIAYVDVSKGGFKELISFNIPGIPMVPDESLSKEVTKKIESAEDAKRIMKAWDVDDERITNGVHSFVDKENKVYYNTADKKIFVLGLKNPNRPKAGIQVYATRDLNDLLPDRQRLVGLNLTYDGKLVVLGSNSLSILNRNLTGDVVTHKFHPDETVTNSVAVDQWNGIYVASDKVMRKLVWTGSELSISEKDGGWMSKYDTGNEPKTVKSGTGTGSTPTLMGYGADDDKLVVITDGADRMKLVAFWRDEIPGDARKVSDAKSKRVAGQIPVTCGFERMPEFIQTEQSVAVKGYGAFVVNNIRSEGEKDRLLDVLLSGPVIEPAAGVERFEWNPRKNEWVRMWARNDIVSTSMVPAISEPSNIVVVNGYTKNSGWVVTGLDWNTGKIVHRIVLGKNSSGNGAYGALQYLSNTDLLFNGIGGTFRIPYASERTKQAQQKTPSSI